MKHWGYSPGDFMPCEWCGGTMVDVHHLTPRSLSKKADVNKIDNLAGVCRICHDKAHASKAFNEELRAKHIKKIKEDSRDTEMTRYFNP